MKNILLGAILLFACFQSFSAPIAFFDKNRRPFDSTGLIAWYSSDRWTTSGGNVFSIINQRYGTSTGDMEVVNVGGELSSALNGFSALRVTPDNDAQYSSSDAGVIAGVIHIFIVAREPSRDVASSYERIFTMGSDNVRFHRDVPANGFYLSRNSSGTPLAYNFAVTGLGTKWYIASIKYNSGSTVASFWLENAESLQTFSGSVGNDAVVSGDLTIAGSNSLNVLDEDIVKILIYNANLTSQREQNIINSLRQEFNF